MEGKRLKHAVQAATKAMKNLLGPGRYAPGGKALSCSHCGGDRFQATRMRIVAGYQIACVDCGLIQWFSARPERLDSAS